MRDRVLRSKLRKSALVTLKSGESIGGVVTETDRQALVLQGANQYAPDGQRTNEAPIDGEVVVLLADVAYLQFP